MHICMCVYAYMRTCVAYMRTCVHAYMHTCVHVCMCICVYVYMCVCVYVYMCICTHMHTQKKLYISLIFDSPIHQMNYEKIQNDVHYATYIQLLMFLNHVCQICRNHWLYFAMHHSNMQHNYQLFLLDHTKDCHCYKSQNAYGFEIDSLNLTNKHYLRLSWIIHYAHSISLADWNFFVICCLFHSCCYRIYLYHHNPYVIHRIHPCCDL